MLKSHTLSCSHTHSPNTAKLQDGQTEKLNSMIPHIVPYHITITPHKNTEFVAFFIVFLISLSSWNISIDINKCHLKACPSQQGTVWQVVFYRVLPAPPMFLFHRLFLTEFKRRSMCLYKSTSVRLWFILVYKPFCACLSDKTFHAVPSLCLKMNLRESRISTLVFISGYFIHYF